MPKLTCKVLIDMPLFDHNYQMIDDCDLVKLLNDGDYTAFKEIYERYNKLLFTYAYRKIKDEDEAKDIVQDVFINFWANRDEFSLKTTLSAYLYKAVLHKVLNTIRHSAICEKHANDLGRLFTTHNDKTDYLIREKDITSLIEKEIALLPPRMQEIFLLRTKEHLTNKEIAERLNLSDQTVATQIKRALKVLKIKFGVHMVLIYLLMGGRF